MSMPIMPPGGGFLLQAVEPDSVFTPEDFSAESRLIARTADEFLKKEVLPLTERIEGHDLDLMRDLMKKAGQLGLLGADVPEVYGGLGLDTRTSALIAEKLNWQQSFALTHEAHTVIGTLPLLYFGNHQQKSKYLPKLATGEWIGAFCLSEPGSGSDALGAQTRATYYPAGEGPVRRPDPTQPCYVLNGTKMWITNTAFADLFTVFAKVDGEKFSCFLVERGYPGLSFGKEEHKLGMRGTSTRRVILENVAVPVENLVGEVGKGHYAALCALNMGRFKLEAGAVGGLKETIAVCARYAKERKQFGRPLASFGLIQAKLGEMAARTFALESAIYRLAGLLDGALAGIQPDADDAPKRYHRAAEEYSIECNIVKVAGSELYSWATDEGIQIHGGYGYTEEFPMARAWRDQRLLRIGEGANEIVRLAIVNTILKRARQDRLDLAAVLESIPTGMDGLVGSLAMGGAYFACRQLMQKGAWLIAASAEILRDSLANEQEILAMAADLIVGGFVAESALARAAKLAANGTDKKSAELASVAAETYLQLVMDETAGTLKVAADRLIAVAGRAFDTTEHPPMPGQTPGIITFRRKLADAVLEQNGYPWQ